MKLEWRKQEKELYHPTGTPALITVPEQKFIKIKGHGDPNGEDFSLRVGALYSLAYAIKMQYKALNKNQISPEDITDFTVYPLEGIWDFVEPAIQKKAAPLNKDNLRYTIMIRQPDFITQDLYDSALESVCVKKPDSLYREIVFDTYEDGLCVEILHTGSFDEEPASFGKLDRFAAEHRLQRRTGWHREIYLTNANRTPPEKAKTILRYPVEKETS